MFIYNIFRVNFFIILFFIALNPSFANSQNYSNSTDNQKNTTKNSKNKSQYFENESNIKDSNNKNNSDNINKNSLSIGVGETSGVAHEIVYDYGRKISHLEWKFKDVRILNFNFDRKLPDNFGTKISYANSINEGSNKNSMTDTDWRMKPYDNGNKYPDMWSDRSFSKMTVKQIQKFDISGYSNHFNKNLQLKLGYRYEKYKFNDNGINYIYSESGFRKDTGSLYGGRGISYQQNFYVPYVGLEINKKFFNDKIIFNLFGNYSPIASAKDIDLHHLTNVRYTGYFDGIKYYNWGTSLATKIDQDLYLGASFDYTYYSLTTGYMIIEKINENQKYRNIDKNSAGITNKNTQYSIFLKYNFNSKL